MTVDGRRVRRAALVRSDQLCRLDDSGRDALFAHGVRTVIDLRNPAEAAKDPDPVWQEPNVDYVLVPQQDEQFWGSIDPARTRSERDSLVIDQRAEHIVAMVRAFADAAPGGVLIHCLAGKDRTGIAVAMLLGLVGVSEADIAADYALSEGSLAAERAAALAAAPDDEARARIERAERWLREHAEDPQLLATLGRLCMAAELWGKAQNYLEASLSFAPSRADHLELARLAEREGRAAEAQKHFRSAGELP